MADTDLIVSFGEWVKRRRRTLDLTQLELAQRSGCSVFALRKIESEERRPSKQLAALLARSLEVPSGTEATFVKVARGELRVDRLGPPSPGTPPDYRPAATLAGSLSNLPVMPTPFIGREAELISLGELLHNPECRLLTVMGLGGMGKTRLAVEAAGRYQVLFPDGVWFIPLSSLSSSTFLVPTIASALRLSIQGQADPLTQLLSHLRPLKTLLVIDNVEHLLDGVSLFTTILRDAPHVRMLVTSRERLNLLGEWVFELHSLPVPSVGYTEHFDTYTSVALFMQGARRAQVAFDPQGAERGWILRICELVEGIPLGIELASAWVSTLSCEEIAHEIERSIDFLTTSLRDFPDRQRSLRATFEHSWRLLTEDERCVLSELAVFRGGFDRTAAEEVVGADLPALLALMSKSLVRRSHGGRFHFHEVVRQYAQSYLDQDAETHGVRDRHAAYYLDLLRDREAHLKSAGQQDALQELTDEIHNIRAAWAWVVEQGYFNELEPALRAYGLLFDIRGWLAEGIEQLQIVVDALRARAEEMDERVLGQVLAQQGLLQFRQGRHDTAVTLFRESLELLRPLNLPRLLIDPLTFLGIVMFLRGELDEARKLKREALLYAQAEQDKWYAALILFNLGYIDGLLGDYELAHRQMSEGIAIWRNLGDPRFTALGLNFLSETAISLGRLDEAHSLLEESLALTTQVGDRWGIGTAYRHLGLVAMAERDIEEAKALFHKSLGAFDGVITGWDVAQSLAYLGDASLSSGEIVEAQGFYREAFRLAVAGKARPVALSTLCGLASTLREQGRSEEALALLLFVSRETEGRQHAYRRSSELAAEIREELSREQFRAAERWAAEQSLETIARNLF